MWCGSLLMNRIFHLPPLVNRLVPWLRWLLISSCCKLCMLGGGQVMNLWVSWWMRIWLWLYLHICRSDYHPLSSSLTINIYILILKPHRKVHGINQVILKALISGFLQTHSSSWLIPIPEYTSIHGEIRVVCP